MTIKLSESEHALLVAAALPNGAAGTTKTWLRTMRTLEKLGLVTATKARDYCRADATDVGLAALNTKGQP